MQYIANNNVVENEQGEVMCVVAPVRFLGWVAVAMAKLIAESMNEYDYDSRDILTGGER